MTKEGANLVRNWLSHKFHSLLANRELLQNMQYGSRSCHMPADTLRKGQEVSPFS